MHFDTPLSGWFIYLAWNIDLSTRGPFVKASKQRLGYQQRLIDLAQELRNEGITTAHPLEIRVIIPVRGGPRYDLALLVHGNEQMQDELVARTAALGLPEPELALTGRNSGRISDTEAREGEILLNHFAGDVPSSDAVEVWKSVADWYARVLNVDNSTLIEFTSGAPYLIMNYAVLPGRVAPFLAGQILRPSFHRLVRKQLHKVGITPFPVVGRRLGT